MFHFTTPAHHIVGINLLVLSWLTNPSFLLQTVPMSAATVFYLVSAYVTWKNRNK